MNFMSSVGAKFGMAFAVVLLIILGDSFFLMSRMSVINDSTVTITRHWLRGIELSYNIRHNMHGIRRGQLGLDQSLSMESVKIRAIDFSLKLTEIQKSLTMYAAIITYPEEQIIIDRINKGVADVTAENERFLQFMMASDTRDAEELRVKHINIQRVMADTEHAVDDLIVFNLAGSKKAKDAAGELYKKSLKLALSFSALALAVSVLLLVVMTRYIKRPLVKVVSDVATIGSGDLSLRLLHDRGDEIGQLQSSLVTMVSSLHQVVGRVKFCATNLNGVSSEIVASSQDMALRTEESANSLRTTTSSMAELTRSVRKLNSDARNVNQLALSAAEIAKRGGVAVAQVVSKMEEITVSSKQIAAIVDVIDSIAFQTNILALNAAVESSRAGEQGLGFAVVASEVRALAHRSAVAAKEIKELIGSSVLSVETGVDLVHAAGATMNDIVTSVEAVSKIIADITESSSSQTDDINEINSAVEELEHMTEQNAAMVEESYATAEVLIAQANQLISSIDRFRL